MLSLTERMTTTARKAEKLLMDKYAKDWLKSEDPEKREEIWLKAQVLKDLTKTMVHAIRGEE